MLCGQRHQSSLPNCTCIWLQTRVHVLAYPACLVTLCTLCMLTGMPIPFPVLNCRPSPPTPPN